LVIAQVILELEDVLDQVVSIRILNKEVDTADDDICQSELLGHEALLKAALHHTAAVLVRADLITVIHASLEDELCVGSKVLSPWAVGLLRRVRSFESQQKGLDHVVAIWVRGQVKDIL